MTPATVGRSDRSPDDGFRSIVRNFAPRLYCQAYRILGDADQAAEAVQEILLNVHRSRDSFRGECALGTWIYRIALNTIVSYRRLQHNHPLLLMAPRSLQHIADQEVDIEEAYERKEECEGLARCIAKLPPRESAAITLFYMDGFDYKEIASIMETSVGAVGLLLHRGREHLHIMLTGKQPGARK